MSQQQISTPSTLSTLSLPSITFTKTWICQTTETISFDDFKKNHLAEDNNESKEDYNKRAIVIWELLLKKTSGIKKKVYVFDEECCYDNGLFGLEDELQEVFDDALDDEQAIRKSKQ